MSKRKADLLISNKEGCICASFVQRVKRFSILCKADGRKLWAHSNNTGGMLGLLRSGATVLLSPAVSPDRKLAWTLERVWLGDARNGTWVGLNTQLPNRMLEIAFHSGLLTFLEGYTCYMREKKNGASRLDARITGAGKPDLWVECKSVTLVEDGVAAFPDAPSERGRKHLQELMRIVKGGERGAMFYLVQRNDAQCFGAADYIDPEYARLLFQAMACGVEVYAYSAIFGNEGIGLGRSLPVQTKQWEAE